MKLTKLPEEAQRIVARFLRKPHPTALLMRQMRFVRHFPIPQQLCDLDMKPGDWLSVSGGGMRCVLPGEKHYLDQVKEDIPGILTMFLRYHTDGNGRESFRYGIHFDTPPRPCSLQNT